MGPNERKACTKPTTALDSAYDWNVGTPLTTRSWAVFSTCSRRRNGAFLPSRSRFASKRKLSSGVTSRFRPQTKVASKCPCESTGTLVVKEPVTRLTPSTTPAKPGGSGLARYPYETCRLTVRNGFADSRTANESKGRKSKSQRFSSGSRPLNHEPSSLRSRVYTPAVATPKLACVASCQWWEMGGKGSPSAETRCMKAV